MVVDHASWQIKDTAVLTELIALMDMTEREAALLSQLHPHAQNIAPQLSKAFYERLIAHPHTAEYLHGVPIEHRHNTLEQWFLDLFSGRYDEAYARKRLAIGHTHVRIGLPVRYPLAMLDVIMTFGEIVAGSSTHPQYAIQAFRKLLALDVAIFNQAYEDSQLTHLAELTGGERLARRLLSGNL